MISILIPTRNRPKELKITLDSIIKNASNVNNYEILIAVDNDDKTFDKGYITYLQTYKKVNIKVVYTERLYYRNFFLYLNLLAEVSSGDLLWTFADDFKILSDSWDIHLKKYEKTFNYIKVDLLEGRWESHFSILPIIPRKWYDITGGFGRWSQTDGWLWGIAKDLNISVFEKDVVVTNFVDADNRYHTNNSFPDLLEIDKQKIKNYLNALTWKNM